MLSIFYCLLKKKLNVKFLLASLKNLPILKTVPKAAYNLVSGFPFSHWLIFSNVLYIYGQLSKKF